MADGGEEYVRVPKANYEKATAAILRQHGIIKQQELKLKASQNLFVLLQSKDEEVRRARETETSLRSALHRVEAQHQRILSERIAAPAPQSRTSPNESSSSSRLEEDSALAKQYLSSDDVETDCAVNLPPHSQTFKDFSPGVWSQTSKSRTDSTTLGSVSLPTSSLTSAVAPSHSSITQPQLISNLPPAVACSSHSHSMVSKDLLDKLMQQNVKLKKSIRDILHQKGLTVTDYLEKREYEDVAEMLRHDVRRLENQVAQLQGIIRSRDSGRVDELSQKCSELTAMVSQLERKLSVQQSYVQEAYAKLRDDANRPTASASNMDRSTSPPADAMTVSSTNYQLMLEDAQRMKREFGTLQKAYEQMREQLDSMQSENMNMRRHNEELSRNQKKIAEELSLARQREDQRRKEYDSLLAEKQAVQSQVVAFEEDFNIERRERIQQEQQYQQKLAQHQEWVRRLANETQKLRASWENEKAVRQELESQLHQQRQSPRMSCSAMAIDQPGPAPLSTVVDFDGESDDILACPRCERQFLKKDGDKFRQHIKRCKDD